MQLKQLLKILFFLLTIRNLLTLMGSTWLVKGKSLMLRAYIKFITHRCITCGERARVHGTGIHVGQQGEEELL